MLLPILIINPLLIIAGLLLGKYYPLLIVNLILLAIYSIGYLRLKLVATPLFNVFANLLPSISQTEREALMAGDVWLSKEIFKLKPDWDSIINTPNMSLTDEEQNYLDTVVPELCKLCDDWQYNRDVNTQKAVIKFMQQHRLWGLIIPKEYNGLDFSPYAQSRIVSTIASKSLNMAILTMVPNSLGPSELLIKYGTTTQKKRYLPRLAAGEEIPCFALTSTTAGSDAGSMLDKGIVCEQMYAGQQTLGISLTWNKRYITLAPIATIMSLAVNLYDPEKLLSTKVNLGITLCLIPTNHPGVVIGDSHQPMGFAFPNGTVSGNEVFVPMEMLVGGQENIGKGWSMLMECLAVGRSLSLPALSTGGTSKCLLTASAYIMTREQFNLPISKFEGIQEAFAQIAGFTYIIKALNEITVSALERGIHPSIESAIAKYHTTELGRKVVNHTMDILAGKAIQYGPLNFIGTTYQAAPISITVEGANILTRNLIIFGQGIMRSHPYLVKEINCLAEKSKQNLHAFEGYLNKHVWRAMRLIGKSLYYNLTSPANLLLPSKYSNRRRLNRYANGVALISEFVLIYFGGAFKTKEGISASLGDIISGIYMSYGIISYQAKQDFEHQALFNWSLEYLDSSIREAFARIYALIPNRALALLMEILIFPLRVNLRKTYYRHEKAVTQFFAKPSKARDALTDICHKGGDDTKAINDLEAAFNLVPKVSLIYAKLKKQGVNRTALRTASQILALQQQGKLGISVAEIELLVKYTQFVANAMAVDAFSK